MQRLSQGNSTCLSSVEDCRNFSSHLFCPQRLRVAIIAERIGGQVKETVGIENLISIPQTTGSQLADALKNHIGHYPVEVFENRRIEKAELQGKEKKVFSGGGETFTAPAVIIATGASWRKLNVEGETEYIGRGVAFARIATVLSIKASMWLSSAAGTPA